MYCLVSKYYIHVSILNGDADSSSTYYLTYLKYDINWVFPAITRTQELLIIYLDICYHQCDRQVNKFVRVLQNLVFDHRALVRSTTISSQSSSTYSNTNVDRIYRNLERILYGHHSFVKQKGHVLNESLFLTSVEGRRTCQHRDSCECYHIPLA